MTIEFDQFLETIGWDKSNTPSLKQEKAWRRHNYNLCAWKECVAFSGEFCGEKDTQVPNLDAYCRRHQKLIKLVYLNTRDAGRNRLQFPQWG